MGSKQALDLACKCAQWLFVILHRKAAKKCSSQQFKDLKHLEGAGAWLLSTFTSTPKKEWKEKLRREAIVLLFDEKKNIIIIFVLSSVVKSRLLAWMMGGFRREKEGMPKREKRDELQTSKTTNEQEDGKWRKSFWLFLSSSHSFIHLLRSPHHTFPKKIIIAWHFSPPSLKLPLFSFKPPKKKSSTAASATCKVFRHSFHPFSITLHWTPRFGPKNLPPLACSKWLFVVFTLCSMLVDCRVRSTCEREEKITFLLFFPTIVSYSVKVCAHCMHCMNFHEKHPTPMWWHSTRLSLTRFATFRSVLKIDTGRCDDVSEKQRRGEEGGEAQTFDRRVEESRWMKYYEE